MPGHREVNASPRVNPMDVLFSRLVRFLDANGVEIAALDDAAARTAGELLGARDASDVVEQASSSSPTTTTRQW